MGFEQQGGRNICDEMVPVHCDGCAEQCRIGYPMVYHVKREGFTSGWRDFAKTGIQTFYWPRIGGTPIRAFVNRFGEPEYLYKKLTTVPQAERKAWEIAQQCKHYKTR